MTIAEMRAYRKVPAKRGMRVTVDGKPGVITGNKGDSLLVRFDGYKWSMRCHPWWRVTYFLADGSKVEYGD